MNAIASPAAREPGPLVILLLKRTVAKVDSMGFVVLQIDRWDSQPAPLVLCESRSLAVTLRNLAFTYGCPLASFNRQTRGFLITRVAPNVVAGKPVLYVGDKDYGGGQIEAANQRTLVEYSPAGLTVVDNWERIALTDEQIRVNNLPAIRKPVRRFRPVRYFDAVEAEAPGQANIVNALRARLDDLLQPLPTFLNANASSAKRWRSGCAVAAAGKRHGPQSR